MSAIERGEMDAMLIERDMPVSAAAEAGIGEPTTSVPAKGISLPAAFVGPAVKFTLEVPKVAPSSASKVTSLTLTRRWM